MTRLPLKLPQIAIDQIPRPALWSRLDQISRHVLTLIIAPPGYGKTMAVTSWLLRGRSAVLADACAAWCSLDPLHNNLHRFASTVVESIAAACDQADLPGRERWADQSVCARTRQVLNNREQLAPESLAAQLVEEVAGLPGRLLLVLDDYHAIRDPRVHAFVQWMLRYPPANLHVIMLTRKEPPFSTARLRSDNKLLELTVNDLQLTHAEAELLLAQTLGVAPTGEMVTLLHQYTEGWAVGVRLMGLSLRGQPDAGRLQSLLGQSRPERFIASYLMDEALTHQPAGVQDFLLRTSLLRQLDPDLCAAAAADTEGRHSRAVLAQVVAENLFVVPCEDRPGCYRYHDLFRAMLQQRLHLRYARGEVAEMRLRIAAAMVQAGDIDQALPMYLAADAPAAAVALLEAQAPPLMAAEHWLLLERYLSYLPRALVEERPALLLAWIWIYHSRAQFGRVSELIERVSTLLAQGEGRIAAEDFPVFRAQLAVARHLVLVFVGPMPTRENAGELQAALEPLAVDSYAGSTALNLLSWTYRITGDFDRAVGILQKALDQLGLRPNYSVLRLLHGQMINYGMNGRLEEAWWIAQAYRDLAERAAVPLRLCWATAVLGEIAYHRDQLDLAADCCRQVIENRHVAPFLPLVMSLRDAIGIAAVRGDFAWIAAQLAHLRQDVLAAQSAELLRAFGALEALLWLRQGDEARALRWAQSIETPQGWLSLPIVHLVWLECLIRQGDAAALAAAHQHAEKMAALYQHNYTLRYLLDFDLLRVSLAWAQGARPAGLALLEETLRWAVPLGFQRPLLDAYPGVQQLLEQLAGDPKKGCLAAQLLGVAAPSAAGQAAAVYQAAAGWRISARPGAAGAGADGRQLSPREMQILKLLAEGLTNRDIAAATWTSPHTVRNHVVKICDKLGVDTRRDAVSYAREHGMV